jgi:hypothetical protein
MKSFINRLLEKSGLLDRRDSLDRARTFPLRQVVAEREEIDKFSQAQDLHDQSVMAQPRRDAATILVTNTCSTS